MSLFELRRRPHPVSLVAGALLTLTLVSCRDAAPPHIVWIVIDAQRADRLGTYGYRRDTSPFIDSLAETGVIFDNAMSQESYTHPSVASYFTSTYPLTNGVLYDNPTIDVLDERFVTIAEILNDSGYETTAVVFNPHLRAQFGLGQGFDHYYDQAERWEKGRRHYSTYETATQIHDRTQSVLANRKKSPQFIYLHYLDVHDPYMPPPPYHGLFLPPGREPVVDVLYPEGGNLPFHEVPRLVRSQYDGSIRYTDAALEQLFAMMAEHGLTRDNTIFVLSADHGEEFFDRHPGDRGGTYHGRTLYREQIRVPLIFSLPERSYAGQRFAAPVSLVDVTPTLVELIGLDPEPFEQFQGRSLVPMIERGRERGGFVYSGGNHHRAVLISGRFKFYRNDRSLKTNRMANFKQPDDGFEYDFEDELYDIENDPLERVNVIQDHPDVAKRMEEEVKRITVELSRRDRTTSTEMDESTRRQLEALGYIEPP